MLSSLKNILLDTVNVTKALFLISSLVCIYVIAYCVCPYFQYIYSYV